MYTHILFLKLLLYFKRSPCCLKGQCYQDTLVNQEIASDLGWRDGGRGGESNSSEMSLQGLAGGLLDEEMKMLRTGKG